MPVNIDNYCLGNSSVTRERAKHRQLLCILGNNTCYGILCPNTVLDARMIALQGLSFDFPILYIKENWSQQAA